MERKVIPSALEERIKKEIIDRFFIEHPIDVERDVYALERIQEGFVKENKTNQDKKKTLNENLVRQQGLPDSERNKVYIAELQADIAYTDTIIELTQAKVNKINFVFKNMIAFFEKLPHDPEISGIVQSIIFFCERSIKPSTIQTENTQPDKAIEIAENNSKIALNKFIQAREVHINEIERRKDNDAKMEAKKEDKTFISKALRDEYIVIKNQETPRDLTNPLVKAQVEEELKTLNPAVNEKKLKLENDIKKEIINFITKKYPEKLHPEQPKRIEALSKQHKTFEDQKKSFEDSLKHHQSLPNTNQNQFYITHCKSGIELMKKSIELIKAKRDMIMFSISVNTVAALKELPTDLEMNGIVRSMILDLEKFIPSDSKKADEVVRLGKIINEAENNHNVSFNTHLHDQVAYLHTQEKTPSNEQKIQKIAVELERRKQNDKQMETAEKNRLEPERRIYRD